MMPSNHQKHWDTLLTQHRRRRLPHALLLIGQSDLELQEFAQNVAQAVLCQNVERAPCKQCRSCHLLNRANHPDFFQTVPEGTQKTIKIDAVRSLTEALGRTSQLGGYKVAVIAHAESLNRSAANALLKTLEEPLGETLLILTTHRMGTLPITLVSRCQRFVFTSSRDETFRCVPKEMRDELLMNLIAVRNQQKSPLAVAAGYLKMNVTHIFLALAAILMDLVRLHVNAAPDDLLNKDRLKELMALRNTLSRDHILHCWDRLQEDVRLMASTIAINHQLLLEDLFLHWGHSC